MRRKFSRPIIANACCAFLLLSILPSILMQYRTVEHVVLGLVVVFAVVLIAYTVYRYCHTRETFASPDDNKQCSVSNIASSATEFVLGGSDAVVPSKLKDTLQSMRPTNFRSEQNTLHGAIVKDVLSPTARFLRHGVNTASNTDTCVIHEAVFLFDVPHCGQLNTLPQKVKNNQKLGFSGTSATFTMEVHYTYQSQNSQPIGKSLTVLPFTLSVNDWSQTVSIPFTNTFHANTANITGCELTCTKSTGDEVITLQALQFVKRVPQALSGFGTEYKINGTARINRPIGFTSSTTSTNYAPSCPDIAFVNKATHRVFYSPNAMQYDSSVDMAPYSLPLAHFSDTQSYTMELQCTDKVPVDVSSVTLSFAFASDAGTAGTKATKATKKATKATVATVVVPVKSYSTTRFTIAFSCPAYVSLQSHSTPLALMQVTSNETITAATLLYVPLQERNALTPSVPVTLLTNETLEKEQANRLHPQPTTAQNPKPQLVFPHTVFTNDLQAVVSMIYAPQYNNDNNNNNNNAQTVKMMTQSYRRPKGFASTQGWYCCGAVSPSNIASSHSVNKKTELLTLVVTYGSSGGSGGGDRIVFTISPDGRAFLKLNSVNVATATLENHRAGMGVSWMLCVFQETCYITLKANRNNGKGRPNVVGQPPSTFTLKNTQMLSKLYYHKHVTIAKVRNPKGAYPPIRCITTQVASNTTLYGTFYTSIQSQPVPEVPYLWQTWDRQALQAKVLAKYLPTQTQTQTQTKMPTELTTLQLPTADLAYEQGCNALFYISNEYIQNTLQNNATLSQLFTKTLPDGTSYRELFKTDVFMLAMIHLTPLNNMESTQRFNLALFVRKEDSSSGGGGNSPWCAPQYFADDTSLMNDTGSIGAMFLFSSVGSTGRLCQKSIYLGQAPLTTTTQAFRIPKTHVLNCKKQNLPLVQTIRIDPSFVRVCLATDRVTCSDCNPYNSMANAAEGCGHCVSLPTGNPCNGLTSFGMQFDNEFLWFISYIGMKCTGTPQNLTRQDCIRKLNDPTAPDVNTVSFVPDETGSNNGTCYECKDPPTFTKHSGVFTYSTLNQSGFGVSSLL